MRKRTAVTICVMAAAPVLLIVQPLQAAASAGRALPSAPPNILIILADDLGYGDVQCYNPQRGKIPTPHIDRLAAEGLRFTDGHSSSGVCSPSRYALLTGRYHWRSRLQQGIVPVWGAPLIAPDRLTVAGLAQRHGYRTACIGKWHLGRDWPITKEHQEYFTGFGGQAGGGGEVSTAVTDAHRATWRDVFSRPIPGGPTTRGFDEYFGTDVPNWPPYCFIENDRTVGIPSELLPADKLRTNQASLQGPALGDWQLEAILPTLGDRAVDFIRRQAKAKQPFLLYLPLTSPHTPLAVNQQWLRKSGLNLYADLVMETDALVGRVLKALNESGAAENTIVLFTSDNGCAPYIGAKELEAKGHFPSGPLRGYKGEVFEGGHRVPFIVRWPGVVKSGTVCGQLVHQADLIATVADVLGTKLPDNVGEDSFSLLPLLQGGDKPVREHAVSCASSGVPGLRRGPWKLILERDPKAKTDVQLYNLDSDIGEKTNLASEKPALVVEMRALMERLITDGRSTPGAKQKNDVQVRRYPLAEAAQKKAASTQESLKTPNILWLIAEDFGQHLGCYGTKEVWTPHLDRLASQGVRYDRFYNGHVCSPSRSAFNTGMYATTIGAHNHRTANKKPLPEGVKVLSDWMRAAGYFTANVRELPPPCDFKGTGKTDWNFKYDDKPFDSASWSDLKTHQPFYAQVNFNETHRAYTAPKKADPAKVDIPPYYPDHPVTREDWGKYLDEATELDRKVGLVLTALEKDGLADNTVVVFFGDNGQSHVRGKQFCYEEGLLVPLIIRWPKSLPVPAHFRAGTVDTRLLHGIDLAPTMLAFVGAPKPPKMQGQVFLGDRCEPDRQYVFGYRDRCDMTVMRIRTVRDDRYRYLRNFTPWVPFLAFNAYKEKSYPVWNLLKDPHTQGKLTPTQEVLCRPVMPEEELYDLEADPWEINNLAQSDKPEHQAELKKLRGVLEQWIEDTDDQGRRMETLEELTTGVPQFLAERDWRPAPGSKEAAEKPKQAPASNSKTKETKKRKKQRQ